MSQAKLTTASVLAFERKLDASDGLLFSGSWAERHNSANWQPITIREKSVRGTISNRLKTKDQDPTRVDAEIEKPNLQTVDIATLNSKHDTLQLRFTLRVVPGAGIPSACNNAAYQEKLASIVSEYIQQHGFKELAYRYAHNLANGRFLWRNRIGAEAVEVHINRLVDGIAQQQYQFNGLDFSLRNFDHKPQELLELAELIQQGLTGEEHVLLEVIAFSRLGSGQEVFPSQELILDQSGGRKSRSGILEMLKDKKDQSGGRKSRTLYSVGGTAAMHSQKIGNAIRTIDTWYPVNEDEANVGPIAVEPYGSVTTQGKAYRQPKEKVDFYSLLDNWLLKDEVPEVEQQHYEMAVLISGGVFGDAE